jgi:hypothetical protein
MTRKMLAGCACLLIVALVGCGGTSTGGSSLTSEQAVQQAKAALAITYSTSDAASHVTQNLNLPLTGLDGATITWASSDPTVITAAGAVSQPAVGDVNVTLTATITVGTTSDTKTFPVTVKGQMTVAQAVAAAKSALAISYAAGDSASAVTQNLTLPASGLHGTTVDWSSSDPAVVSNAGGVNRPAIDDANVTLTATITLGSTSDTKTFPLVVSGLMTQAAAVAEAKSALSIVYASGDSSDTVTKSVTLPASGLHATSVSWASSDPVVITNAGIVSQPPVGDANVTLTATITLGSASDTKAFPVTVKAQMTEAQAVAAAKSALVITYAAGDSAVSVTKGLTLPASGLHGTAMSWASSDPSVVTNAGIVSQPNVGDANVTLTATITLGSASDTKAFPVTVKAQMTEAEAVAAAKSALVITYAAGDSAVSVTKGLTLPALGLHATTVSWVSSDLSVITNAGVVSQPPVGDASVTLTATLTLGSTSDTKAFPVTVKAQMTEAEAVADEKTALSITYAAGDSATAVTQNVTLASSGAHGTEITWASTDSNVVSIAGAVTRPEIGDAGITLTATITLGAATTTKAFPLTVKAQWTEAQALADAIANLSIGYATDDSADSVTKDLTLAPNGLHGSTVTWGSNDMSLIGNTGTVHRPITGDTPVTLTATVTLGSSTDKKDFPLTLIALMTDAQAIDSAKNALEIGYAPGDADTTVTQTLDLPLTGINGCTVSWTSSDPSIISNDGSVFQPVTGDVPVTLTATIHSHGFSDTKPFIVMVKAQMTDAEALAAAKAALQIVYAEGDSAASVTQNVVLPLTGSSNCTISWATSDNSLLALDGSVSRPEIGDVPVTLTATIQSHEVSDTLEIPILIKGQISDPDAVAAAKQDLHIGYGPGDSADHVTQNLTLPSTGTDACTISWSSDVPLTISDQGVVIQPESDPVPVTLTATITSHGYSDTVKFMLTVAPPVSDAARVAADKAALTINFGPGDTAASVTGNIFLPVTGANGSTITWSSDTPAIISNSGGVTVPSDNDAVVTMTASITYNETTDTANFPLTVKALLLSDWVNTSNISPGNGAIEVDPGIVVRIPFQRDLDASTIDDTTFQIVQTSNGQMIPISATYDVASKTVSLTPESTLAEGTQYSTVVSTGLKDSEETNLTSPMGFSFTTLSYASILSQWKFNGDGSDASGHGNQFTAFNDFGNPNALYVSDAVHEGTGSLYLNGTSEYGISNINLGTQLTVAVWVNVDNPIQDDMNTLMSNADTGEESDGFKLSINRWGTNDRSVNIEVGNGSTGGKWTAAPGLILPGTWYHLAFVIDQPGHAIKIFYNGVEVPLTFVSDQGFQENDFQYNFKTSGPFTIGAFPGIYYNYKGHLDDMRVYNRVLSPEEIAKIAQER